MTTLTSQPNVSGLYPGTGLSKSQAHNKKGESLSTVNVNNTFLLLTEKEERGVGLPEHTQGIKCSARHGQIKHATPQPALSHRIERPKLLLQNDLLSSLVDVWKSDRTSPSC